jgi:hypothetical protein
MIRIKSAIDAPDWQANGGLKDKQIGDFILIMGLNTFFLSLLWDEA